MKKLLKTKEICKLVHGTEPMSLPSLDHCLVLCLCKMLTVGEAGEKYATFCKIFANILPVKYSFKILVKYQLIFGFF